MTDTKTKEVKTETTNNGLDALNQMIDRAKKAQEIYSSFTQEQVDKIFKAAAAAADKADDIRKTHCARRKEQRAQKKSFYRKSKTRIGTEKRSIRTGAVIYGK